MKLSQLFEAPLKDVSYHRQSDANHFDDWGSFSAADRKLIAKYIKDNTYKEKLKGIPFDLYVYIVDDSDLSVHGVEFPEGEIEDAEIKSKIYKYGDDKLTDEPTDSKIELDRGTIVSVLKKVLEDREKDPDGVFLVMGDNYGGDKNQIGLTPWIMVHRLMHAAFKVKSPFASAVGDITQDLYMDRPYPEQKSIERLPFKSAKTGKVTDYGELRAEIATYIMINGKLDFDMGGVPDKIASALKMDIESAIDAAKVLVKDIKGKIFYI